tara:strand:- start:448 stop:1032 length:585 start_codon:yes stop_codon:yes gene_type:complete
MNISSKLSDREIISLYINGKESALNIIINRHRSRIFGYILSKVRDKDTAEDIFQDVFIKIINSLKKGKYNEEGKFIVWAMTITHNLIMDFFRKKKKNRFLKPTDEFDIFDVISDHSLNSEESLIKSQVIDDLNILINELPETQKEVLKLRYFSNMSFKEIADKCDISINTALGRMRYALINIRKIMNKKGVVLT